MTKEELLNKKFSIADFGERKDALYFSDLMSFFESNVCIHKGENRHKNADIIHAYAEGLAGKMTEPILLNPVYRKGQRIRAISRCGCGEVFEAYQHSVRSKNTKSCGCLRIANIKKITKERIK